MHVDFSELVGKTIVEFRGTKGDGEVFIKCSDGSEYEMYHEQDCCERVYLEDITGDIDDIIGSEILLAEESSSRENPPSVDIEYQDSFTWTFYKLATIKGYLDLRWYGESNGWYSEGVSLVRIK